MVDPVGILPTLEDFDAMEHEFQILVSRFVQCIRYIVIMYRNSMSTLTIVMSMLVYSLSACA